MSNDASGSADGHRPPNSASQPDWDAIARFLAGESSADESASVERWLEANPADRAVVESLNTAAVVEPETVDVEAALKRVHSAMNKPERPTLVVDRIGAPRDKRRAFTLITLAAAAAAAFVSFVSFQRDTDSAAVAEAEAHVYSTAIGQRDSILLADGSRIILGPDSRLTVAADYGKAVRSVELQGDAYFDVHHDATKPFSVRVSHALVEDIGTSFSIESDAGDTTTVSVMSGRVRLRPALSDSTAGAVLGAGDRGSLAAGGEVHAHPHTVGNDTAWTTGHLVFEDASLARVTGEIRRWYGVQIEVADTAMLSRHVSTTFDDDEPIDQVLKILGLMLGATVDHQGARATMTPVHGPATVR